MRRKSSPAEVAKLVGLLTAILTAVGALLGLLQRVPNTASRAGAQDGASERLCVTPGFYEGHIHDQAGVPRYRMLISLAADTANKVSGMGHTQNRGDLQFRGKCHGGALVVTYDYLGKRGSGSAYLRVQGDQLTGNFARTGAAAGDPGLGHIELRKLGGGA